MQIIYHNYSKLSEKYWPHKNFSSEHEQVMRDPSGVSRGSGFVAFSTPEEANRAVSKFCIRVIELSFAAPDAKLFLKKSVTREQLYEMVFKTFVAVQAKLLTGFEDVQIC